MEPGPFTPAAAAHAAAAPDGHPDGHNDGGFALYVHWPFCLARCPYCDFNAHVRASMDQARWRAALLRELDHALSEAPDRRLHSIFFGGGTPSLMDPDTVAAVISRARRHWPRSSEPVEITLEANPTSVEADRFRAYAEAGINRLSLGVQSLDDAALAFLGRRHSVAQAEAAIGLAAATFPRWSFDLIYARPDQTAAGWRAELTRALAFGADHLSLYQLTLEPGTPFHGEYSAGRLTPLDGDAAAHLYDVTAEMTAAAGLPAYEISNHARPGQEGRHNLVYWRSGQWVGVGPGAHSRLTDAAGQRLARRRHRAPEAWLAAVEADGHATRDESLIPSGDAFDEALMMGLRLAEGVPLSRLARLGGADRCDGLVRSPAMAGLMDLGFLAWRNDRDGRRLTATPAGRLALDSVLARLLA